MPNITAAILLWQLNRRFKKDLALPATVGMCSRSTAAGLFVFALLARDCAPGAGRERQHLLPEDKVGRNVSVDVRGIQEALRHIYDATALADELMAGALPRSAANNLP